MEARTAILNISGKFKEFFIWCLENVNESMLYSVGKRPPGRGGVKIREKNFPY